MQFFPGMRRKVSLVDHYVKLNAQGEKRMFLKFSMSLLDQSLVGMPGSIGAAHDAVAKIENGIVEADIGVDVDGQTIECYETDGAMLRTILITAADLTKLTVSRTVKEDGPENDVNLSFVTTVPASRALNDWAYEHRGMVFFAVFEASQPPLDFKPAEPQPADKQMPLQVDMTMRDGTHATLTMEPDKPLEPFNGVTHSAEAASGVAEIQDEHRHRGRPKKSAASFSQLPPN